MKRLLVVVSVLGLVLSACYMAKSREEVYETNGNEYTFRLTISQPGADRVEPSISRGKYRFEALAAPESSLTRGGDTWDSRGVYELKAVPPNICQAHGFRPLEENCLTVSFRSTGSTAPSHILQIMLDNYGLPDGHDHQFVSTSFKNGCQNGQSECIVLYREEARGDPMRGVSTIEFGRVR